MSILRYLIQKNHSNASVPEVLPEDQDLPNPAESSNPSEIRIVNEVVKDVLQSSTKEKKRGTYRKFDDKVKLKVANYARQHGDAAAIRNYFKNDPAAPNESTIRGWRKRYLVLDTGDSPPTTMSVAKRGRPAMIDDPTIDKVKAYIQLLTEKGGTVNRAITIAATKGFIISNDRSILKEHGGTVEIDKNWAQRLLEKMGYVRRKGTKAARKLPENFDAIKVEFHQRITNAVKMFRIPPSMVLNWDQTGVNIVPVGEWTLAPRGSKQVSIFALDDKRQITVLFTITLDGQLLPPQVLYAGKTHLCHPTFKFPSDWDVWHSESHWSTESTMLHFIDSIIIPYFVNARRELKLKDDQKGLVIFDVFKAHRCESVFQKLRENNIEFIFTPASCTSELQPLDADGGINDAFKKLMKEEFSIWYGEQVVKEFQNQCETRTPVDLRLTTLKPLHSRWMLSSFEKLRSNLRVKMIGWEKTGIEEAFNLAYVVD